MRTLLKVSSIIIALCCGVGPRTLYISAQTHQPVADLFQELQSTRTTNGAADQLMRVGKLDGTTRHYLAVHLPAVIEIGPKSYQPPEPDSAVQSPDPVWLNMVSVAGQLKISRAAPALARWISVRTGMITTLYTEASLENSPAGTALVQIGDPAIPALQRILEEGKLDERFEATYALLRIGSSKANAAVRDHGPHESDKYLAALIKRATSKDK